LAIPDPVLNQHNVHVFKQLWADPVIKELWDRAAEFQIQESAVYFFENVDRIAENSYIPTEKDVLLARTRTTGVTEISFSLEKYVYNLIDVGGQRSERRKWLHYFENVTTLLFCVAISEYDQVLLEDDKVNRMHESLNLFAEIVNGQWFTNTSVILFLNKMDLFETKVGKIPLTVCWPEYRGGGGFDECIGYVKDKFFKAKNDPKKEIYTHVTCATRTDNIIVVFNAVKDIILKQLLQEARVYD